MGLSFRYRNSDVLALDRLDFDLDEGAFFCVMGKTGAGKTTFARCLNGVVPQFFRGEFAGEVSLFGRSAGDRKVAELSREVGMILQDFESQIFSSNVLLEVVFGMENLGVPRIEMRERAAQALATAGLAGFEQRDTSGLSGGEKQRLAIASVLAMKPRLLVLDEPTTDLDPQGKEEVFRLLRAISEEGGTVILIEHEAEQAGLASRIGLMNCGKWSAQGGAAEILRDMDLLISNGVRPPDLAVIARDFGVAGAPLTPEGLAGAFERNPPSWNRDALDLLTTASAVRPAASGQADIFSIEGLEYRYPTGRQALHDVNLCIKQGEFVAIVGPNGSGKTTLVKQLNGLLRPTSGRVALKGEDSARMGIAELGRRVGFVFQNPDHQIFCASCKEEVEFGLKNHGYPDDQRAMLIEQSLAMVGLDGYEERDPFTLTKGERQRLAVASVLAFRPEVVVLDEPTTGLDYVEQEEMMSLVSDLHRQGHTIIIVTHTLWVVAKYAPRTVLMLDGTIAADGPTREILFKQDLISRVRLTAPPAARLAARLGLKLLTPEEFRICARPSLRPLPNPPPQAGEGNKFPPPSLAGEGRGGGSGSAGRSGGR